MDPSGAYASGDGDSEAWASSEGEEQVIEISSHSRILISPRKGRGSAWGRESRRSTSRRLSVDSRKACRDPKSPRSQTSRRSVHAETRGWAGSPRTRPSHNQPPRSNNRDGVSDSESDGSLASAQEESDSSGASDAETPVHRRSANARQEKIARSSCKFREAASLDDSMQSLGSPTTPGKEMEQLKATLKKLARHDDVKESPVMPPISTATALHEYLTAATALGGVSAIDQTRPTELTGLKARHASFQPPRSSYMTGARRTKSKSLRGSDSEANARRDSARDKLGGRLGNPLSSEGDRLSLNKTLFSTPPPPFGATGKYGAGLSLPVAPSGSSSAGAGAGGAQGSRAMLSALKALQDKIGRLEHERERLMQQLSDTKATARKREAELASAEKKFSYELEQTKESARAAYDALRCDREELKLQLVKSEARRKAAQVELQHFQELAKTLSAKADDLQSRLQISESHRTRLKAEMKEASSSHSRAVDELQAELTQSRQEQQAAAERNELLEAQFQREASNHAESRERLKDAEQTVASISQLNEKLVAKVMEATEAANQAIKKSKKLQLQQRPSTLLRTTAASRASAAAASEAAARRAAHSTSAGGAQARTLKKKKAATGSAASTTKKPKKANSANNMTLLREANLGKEIPFLLGNSVQPSFSLIGNVQDALRRSDTTYVMPSLLSGAPTTPGSTSSHRQPARKIHSTTSASGEFSAPDGDPVEHMPSTAPAPPPAPSTTEYAAQFSWTPRSTPGGARHRSKQKPAAIKVPPVSPRAYASPMQSQIMEDLGAAVAAAEKEFQRLNKQYRDLVAQMEANNRRGAAGPEGGKAGGSTSSQLSQALGPLLDELEAKAKQLNLLKQVYQQAANSTINPPRHVVRSPEAIRRKTASLRVLNEYRQLESDSRNKGSGRSASPSSHPGANGFFR